MLTKPDISDDSIIALVKERRGKKLNGPEKTLFSGEFWTAQNALELGLIDSIGDLRSTLRALMGLISTRADYVSPHRKRADRCSRRTRLNVG